jgi:hypothetical protein
MFRLVLLQEPQHQIGAAGHRSKMQIRQKQAAMPLDWGMGAQDLALLANVIVSNLNADCDSFRRPFD